MILVHVREDRILVELRGGQVSGPRNPVQPAEALNEPHLERLDRVEGKAADLPVLLVVRVVAQVAALDRR